MTASRIFLTLVRYALSGCDAEAARHIVEAADASAVADALRLAQRHSMLPACAFSLSSLGVRCPDAEKLYRIYLKQIGRHEARMHEISRISAVLDGADIEYIPLKGAVLCDFWPDAALRTSSDIDILVHEPQLDIAVAALCDAGYELTSRGSHDIQFNGESGIRVELHFSLLENYRFPAANEILAGVWEHAGRIGKGSCCRLDDDMLLYYHIAHMAKHYEGGGGCGVRYYADLWLLDRAGVRLTNGARGMLEVSGFLRFYEISLAIARLWFSGEEDTAVIERSELARAEEAILTLGTFGSAGRSMSAKQARRGGKVKYIFHRIFMPYDMLIEDHPSLSGKRYLTPLYQVKRWGDIIARDRGKKAFRELRTGMGQSKKDIERARHIAKLLGLY